MTNRRSFLVGGLSLLVAAPAIVRVESLMKLPPRRILDAGDFAEFVDPGFDVVSWVAHRYDDSSGIDTLFGLTQMKNSPYPGQLLKHADGKIYRVGNVEETHVGQKVFNHPFPENGGGITRSDKIYGVRIARRPAEDLMTCV